MKLHLGRGSDADAGCCALAACRRPAPPFLLSFSSFFSLFLPFSFFLLSSFSSFPPYCFFPAHTQRPHYGTPGHRILIGSWQTVMPGCGAGLGAIRWLETFSQLVVFDFATELYSIPLAPWAISDAPRFPHRGLMIDTSRHFEPIAAVKRVIDSLAYVKLNTLHWHMSDSQCFPLEVQ